MSSLERALGRIAADLEEVGRPWGLVGALGVAAYTEARATFDIDVAVAVDEPTDGASVVAALRSRGYLWQADFGQAMTSLLVPDTSPPGLRLDLLFSLAGIEAEVARAARPLPVLPGLELPVARRGDLIALKLLAAGAPGREHDWRDLRNLLAGANQEDLERARSSVALLAARGMAPRDRLQRDLERVLEAPGSPG